MGQQIQIGDEHDSRLDDLSGQRQLFGSRLKTIYSRELNGNRLQGKEILLKGQSALCGLAFITLCLEIRWINPKRFGVFQAVVGR